eukprot:3370182-Prymnesium_polylepis.1
MRRGGQAGRNACAAGANEWPGRWSGTVRTRGPVQKALDSWHDFVLEIVAGLEVQRRHPLADPVVGLHQLH